MGDLARIRPRGLLIAVVIVMLLGGSLLLTGCDVSLSRTPRMSDAWSKGLPLGLASLNNRVALVADETGTVYALWVDLERDLRFVRLDDRAHFEVDRALDIETNRPQQPALALDGEGHLHLTWLDKVGDQLQLFHTRLSSDGDLLQDAVALSSPLEAGRTAMVIVPSSGSVEIFWSDTSLSRAGIYHVAVDETGGVILPQELLIPDGLWPAAQADNNGFVHLAWQTQDSGGDTVGFHYVVYDPQSRALGPKMVVTEPGIEASLLGGATAGGRFQGPWLGLEDDLVYLGWQLEVRERGQLSTFVFYQPFSQPPLRRPVPDGAFTYPLPQLADPPVYVQGADPSVTGDPLFLPGQPEGQRLAFYTLVQSSPNQEMLQAGVVELQGGQIIGQELVSATAGASLNPTVAADGQGHLHLVWIDTAGFNRYQVIYASTAPQVQEVLNRVTAGEVLDSVLSVGMGAISLIAFAPLALLWILPPFVMLVIYFMITHESNLEELQPKVMLAVTILVQMLIQMGTMASALDGALGSLVPRAYHELGWLIHLLITGLAIGVMLLFLRRFENRTIFVSFLIYAGVNILLSALVYLVPAFL